MRIEYKVFNAISNPCRRVNRINAISARGRMLESRADIDREIVHFLRQLYIGDMKLRPRNHSKKRKKRKKGS